MSATQDLIAAALTAADELDQLCSPIRSLRADELREACARAIVQPDMAEVERLLDEYADSVIDLERERKNKYLSAQRDTDHTELLDYVRGIMEERDAMIADNERLMQIAAQEVSAAPQPVGEFCTDYHCPGDCGLNGHGYQHAPQPVGAAEVPMPEPIGFIDSNDSETWATLTHNAHELAALRISSTVFHVSQMRTYGDAREAAGYARGLAEAGKDAERYLYLRNRDEQFVLTTGGLVRGCFIDSESEDGTLVLLTGADADDAIDAALRGEVKS